MKRRILIECGAAETRAALLIDEEPVSFWFAPARGDEHLSRAPTAGDIYLGRVRSVSKALDGAFLDIGGDRDAFLPYRKSAFVPTEGMLIAVVIKRPAIGEKGAVVAVANQSPGGPGDKVRPGPLGAPVDAAINALASARLYGEPVDVLVDDAAAARILADHASGPVLIDEDLFETYGAEEALAASLEHECSLPGGAHLIIDETEAATVVDVDAGAMAGTQTRQVNDKVNMFAAQAAPAELSRRAIGGRVVIDFLPPSSPAAQRNLQEALKRASRNMIEARFGRLSADGLLDLTMPRARRSLLDEATEPAAPRDWARAGRRFTCDWRAKAAIRALEARLRAAPSARLALAVGKAIGDYIAERPQWRERVAARFGARFDIIETLQLEERAFDVAER